MNDFFDKIQEFIDAAKAKAADLAEKAAQVAEAWAAWLRAQAAGGTIAAMSAADTARLASFKTELQGLAAAPSAQAGGGFFKKLIGMILALIGGI